MSRRYEVVYLESTSLHFLVHFTSFFNFTSALLAKIKHFQTFLFFTIWPLKHESVGQGQPIDVLEVVQRLILPQIVCTCWF